jgi:hypothetical protein
MAKADCVYSTPTCQKGTFIPNTIRRIETQRLQIIARQS